MSKSEAGAVRNSSAAAFDAAAARARFAALREPGAPLFFDNAAGAQVPDEVVAAVREHLEHRNVQRGGRYERSLAVDATIAATRRRLAAFLNAPSAEEIFFGANSTSVMRAVAEAIRPTLKPGDRVVVTELDHEANVGPWLRLERSGAEPRWWKTRGGAEARLELEDLEEILREGRVRVVALPLASNTSGRIVDVAAAARLAREHGAWTFVDAVHYGPHGPIDARSLGADFLAFSGYKIFGPHIGFLWGRRELLNALEPAREHFIPPTTPYAYESGTQNFEGMAGMSAAMHYLATAGAAPAPPLPRIDACDEAEASSLRASLSASMTRIREYETGLAARLLDAVRSAKGVSILGDPDPARAASRVPTVSFAVAGKKPAAVVDHLAARGIQSREGHMYAPRLLRAAGFDPDEGVARVSLCHYNTGEEIARLAQALRAL
ncbi:MAG TPA: cysteine desulfurase-like protein [Candidatus Eisenbacteria bacterium]|nr:cysteine desulfurase-like protein [Candidatus Eisenbacteria bacterium]